MHLPPWVAALALSPALIGNVALWPIAALMLSTPARAVVSTVSYGLAATPEVPTVFRGFAFGVVNALWAAATVITPIAAGAVQQSAGPSIAYLVVLVPILLAGICANVVARATPSAMISAANRG